jgi:hypothetical protein
MDVLINEFKGVSLKQNMANEIDDLITKMSETDMIHDPVEEIEILEKSVKSRFNKTKVETVLADAIQRYKRYLISVNFEVTGHEYLAEAMRLFLQLDWMPNYRQGFDMMKNIDKTIIKAVNEYKN